MSATLSADGTPTPAAPMAPALAQPRAKAAGRRFRRWHLDTPAPAEEEGWLLTYLDVITLMLVMMVVMLSLMRMLEARGVIDWLIARLAPPLRPIGLTGLGVGGSGGGRPDLFHGFSFRYGTVRYRKASTGQVATCRCR